MADADRIELVHRGDVGARLAVMEWYERSAVPALEYRLYRAVSALSILLFAGAVATVFTAVFALDIRYALALATLVSVLGWFGWAAWFRSYATRVSGALETDTGGPLRFSFTPEGFELDDAFMHWRTAWRGIASVSVAPEGLFLGCRGGIFYVSAKCWPDSAAMARDAARIEAWWRASAARP